MSEQEFTPVYLITGFLESGKTQLINSMLTDDNFSRGQKTLVICCEEGVEEYETAKNTTVVVLDEADEMNTKKMEALDKEYQPERVIIEYNSIWTIERLGSCMLPRKWEVVQIITTVDANTFDNYFTNMRQMLTDPMKDEDIPTFYLDSLDHADRYDRKTVRLVGQAFADRSLPKGYYMFGRMAMTCCANDIQPIGWITQGIQKPSTKAYFRLTAQCKAVDAQGEKMLMLQEARAEIVPPPAEEYLNFNA